MSVKLINQHRFFLFLVMLIISNSFIGSTRLLGQSKTNFYIETDPATFAFDGYALHLRVAPSKVEHWVFSIGTYSMKFPDLLVNINSKNSNQGWDVNLKHGYGIFSDYYFDSTRKGWFIGGQLALQQYKLTNSATGSKEADFSTILFMPRVGYQWFPWKDGLYFMPWFGFGAISKISGKREIDTKSYDLFPLMAFVTVHIGYKF